MGTIVAISTAPAIGGIGIVRMSGDACFEILDKIFKPKFKNEESRIKGYTLKYGLIVDNSQNKVIDEVLVSYFNAPKSYTTEDMCEINSHGGVVVVRAILELCLKNGAKLAQPGEFTKKAFLNGRIDLTQAEATIDIINAKTNKEALFSIKQLEGFLSYEIANIRQKIMSVMVDIEANIDYPEYDIEEVTNKKVLDVLKDTKKDLDKLSNTFEDGKILKDGIKLAIIGKPNSGKSSLLNIILKEDRAIVTEIEGTTRDTIEEFIQIEGILFKIIDTAGIRNAENEIEKIGIEKTKKIAIESDLVIAMLDISKNLTSEDEEIMEIIKNKKAIIVLNKTDLINEKNKKDVKFKDLFSLKKPVVRMSALKKEGIDNLYKEIIKIFNISDFNLDNEVIITNIRHKQLIEEASSSIDEAIKALEANMPIDIIAINIKDVLENLAKITGENVSEDIIKEIFSKFCLGK